MQFLIYILVYPFIWILSLFPMRLLNFVSDIIFLILYYIVGYRKKIVQHNLELSFPEKSPQEIHSIKKKSMHHFVDTFMEMIKSFTISEKELSKRIVFTNPEIINQLHKKNKSIILMAGHYANWEWPTLYIDAVIDHDSFGAYKKINNKYFDKKIKKSRKRFGANLVASSRFIRIMHQHKNNKQLCLYGLLSDQSPMLNKSNYWNKFMGNRVPIENGPEILAKRYDISVIFMDTKRVKRSYYEATFRILAEHPKNFKDFKITDKYTAELENQIKRDPKYYFWTHNRFKHTGKEKIS